jgi:hypothetical protein
VRISSNPNNTSINKDQEGAHQGDRGWYNGGEVVDDRLEVEDGVSVLEVDGGMLWG